MSVVVVKADKDHRSRSAFMEKMFNLLGDSIRSYPSAVRVVA